MTVREPQADCILCGGRCDAHRWTCRQCHRRLLQIAVEMEIEQALPAIAEAEDDT